MQTRLKVAAAVLIAFGANGARAQGIPVIDVANLVQTIQQVLDGITQINNQVQQINQLQSQINSINGIRNLGNVFNNPMLRNYVPAEAYTYLNAINTSGYSGLNATAKALRDVGMVYKQLDLRRIENARALFLYAGTGRDLSPAQRALLATQRTAGRGVSDAAIARIVSAASSSATSPPRPPTREIRTEAPLSLR